MSEINFVEVGVFSPQVHIADVAKNVEEINRICHKNKDIDILVFPELSLTGYTCGDLFSQSKLLNDVLQSFSKLKLSCNQAIIVGFPFLINGSLYNCAGVFARNEWADPYDASPEVELLGIVPKQFLPNYKEFYEQRWFVPADGSEPKNVTVVIGKEKKSVPFGIDLLFKLKDNTTLGIEICEDAWVPVPPSSFQALAGAQILVNISASNELVGKADYRRELVKNQSARCIAAYVYCSAGPTESTNDLVFGGHSLIAENGSILAESDRFKSTDRTIALDIQKLDLERSKTGSFSQNKKFLGQREYRIIDAKVLPKNFSKDRRCLRRPVNAHPFLPGSSPALLDAEGSELNQRCEDIFSIQTAGLAKCLTSAGIEDIYIGVSGGLDSTLALLVAHRTYKNLGKNLKKIHGITMPGFGTSNQTKSNANKLMEYLGISSETIDITRLTYDTFKSIGHKPFGIDPTNKTLEEFCIALWDVNNLNDPVFENTQARIRTMILMNKGFVLGTGDLSELALGWCTYNGDHMSMYNVNCSIPKTLVKFVVRWVAQSTTDAKVCEVLTDIVNTEISPELLPPSKDGKIQSTENIIGPYELHDFFLFNLVRQGFSPEKILYLAKNTDFEKSYTDSELIKWLKVFLTRFFTNQFKRNCVPNGPKVGSVSLSPRGDWRMPSDLSFKNFLDQIDRIPK